MTTLPSPLVTKHNDLIQAAYRLTLAEQRLLLAVLVQIDSHPDKPATTAETCIEVTASAISALFDVKAHKAYGLLAEAVDRLAERWVVIERPDPEKPELERTRTRWISAIDYLPERGTVRVYLAYKVLPYLTQLSGQFTSYRLAHVSGMSSVYAIRLYELLAQWQGKGEREVTLDWLREQFQIAEQYRELCDLKKRVVDPAVAQVNEHSDLWVKYSQRKSGRQVIAFQFSFGLKADLKPPKTNQPSSLPRPAPKLDRAYIEANARPGETWEAATARLSARESSGHG